MLVSHSRAHRGVFSRGVRAQFLIGSGIGALAMMAMAQPAFAQDECGAAASGTVVCVAANNPYANGVTYIAPPVDLTIVLNPDTVIDTSAGTNSGVSGFAIGTQSLTLNGAPASKISTAANGAFGVVLGTDSGKILATTGIIRTSGAGAAGITASSGAGDITVNGGTTTTTGANASGIVAVSDSGVIRVGSGIVNTSGINAVGVAVQSGVGNVRLTVDSITTTGSGAGGAVVASGGAGNAAIRGETISTSGANATAATTATALGTASANLTSVTTTGAGSEGIRATSTGGAAVATVGTLLTNGVNARGIVVTGAQGAIVNYGTITTTGDGATGIAIPAAVPLLGIIASSTATVTGTGRISTTGTKADAINVNATGAVTVSTTATVATTGDKSRGIVARGGAAVSVTAAGVTTLGTGSTAVGAVSTGGSVGVTLSGVNSAKLADGVAIAAATTANLTLVAGSSLNGGDNGATITSGTGTSVNNAGTLGGNVYALAVTGGAANVTNSGTINGALALTDNADTVVNSGSFNANVASNYGAGNDQFTNSGVYNANTGADFGAGTDTFTNSGTFRVLANSATAGTITLAGLETYNNSGLVDLRNGHTGDILSIPGAYKGSGGAMLALDVKLVGVGSTGDQLRIGGAATGSTLVALNALNTTPAVLGATVLVQAGAASSANAFFIADASVDQGLVQYGIAYNPTTFAYSLVGAPGVGVYRTAIFAEGVRNLWLQSGDAWTGHMRELRDNIAANGTGGAGGRIWAQTLGQVEERTNTRAITSLGVTSQVNLGYKQDYFGGQMGVDFGSGGFAFGVTGGYLNSNLNFANSADRINFDDVNGGVYANYSMGGFFINALGKYDYYWGRNNSQTGRYSRDMKGSIYGAKAEIGYRFGTTLFIEPAASLSYTHADIGDFTVASGAFDFDAQDGVRGKGGARIGYTMSAGPAKLSFYGGGNYVHEFKGEDRVSFVSGGQTVTFANTRMGDYGEGTLGLNIGSDHGKISGFFEARYANGGDYEGYGGRAGVRFRF